MKKKEDGVLVKVKVIPSGSRCVVERMDDGSLKVRLTAPAIEGRANRQLVEVLADYFSVRKSEVELVRGRNSRNKVVFIKGIDKL